MGLTEFLISKIKEFKGNVITIGTDKYSDYHSDLSSLESVETLISQIVQEHSKINGFIHFAPVDNYFKSESLNADEINRTVKSFFIIVKSLYNQLNSNKNLIASISFNSVISVIVNLDVDDECGKLSIFFIISTNSLNGFIIKYFPSI